MARWPSEKHFASWLGLAGGRKQSGKRKGRVKAHRNRAGRMFCAAARALGQSVDKALGGFYRPPAGPVGRAGRQRGAGAQTGAPVLPAAALRNGLRRERTQKL